MEVKLVLHTIFLNIGNKSYCILDFISLSFSRVLSFLLSFISCPLFSTLLFPFIGSQGSRSQASPEQMRDTERPWQVLFTFLHFLSSVPVLCDTITALST